MKELNLEELRKIFAEAEKSGRYILVDGEIYHYCSEEGYESLYRENESWTVALADDSLLDGRKAYIDDDGNIILKGRWGYDTNHSEEWYTDVEGWDKLIDEKVRILDVVSAI